MATRRRYLTALGGLGTVALAGCSALSSQSGGGWSERYGTDGTVTYFWHALPTGDGGYLLSGSESTEERSQDGLLVKVNDERDVEWRETSGEDRWDWLDTAVETGDGYIVTGTRSDKAVILGVDGDGDVEWERNFGADDDDSQTYGWRAAPTEDGGIVLVGRQFSSYDEQTAWAVKTDEEGDPDWETTFHPEGAASTRFSDVVPTGEGYLVAGQINADDTKEQLVVGLGDDGDVEWSETYEEGSLERLVPDGDGFVAAGQSDDEAQLLAVDAEGEERWEETFDAAAEARFNDVIAASGGPLGDLLGDSGYLAVGTATEDPDDTRIQRAWLVAVDGDGEATEEILADGDVDSMAYVVEPAHDGGYLVAGSLTEDPEKSTEVRDGWLFSTSGVEGTEDIDSDAF